MQQCVDEGHQRAQEEEANRSTLNQYMLVVALKEALELKQNMLKRRQLTAGAVQSVPRNGPLQDHGYQFGAASRWCTPGAFRSAIDACGRHQASHHIGFNIGRGAESGPLTDHVRLLCSPVEETPDWECPVQKCQVTSPHSLRMCKMFLELPAAERCDRP